MSESSGTDGTEEFFDAEDLTPNRTATLNRKRTSKSSTPQTAFQSTESEFKFPEPVAPPPRVESSSPPPLASSSSHHNRASISSSSGHHYRSTNSEDSESSTRTLKNVSLRDLDCFSEGRGSASGSKPTDLDVKPTTVTFGRQQFRELRRCMQQDEDENPGNTLTPDSQNSSVDGIFPQQKTHPFRIIENDAMSVQSMVSLGRVGRILAGSIDASEMSVGKDAMLAQQQQRQQQQSSSRLAATAAAVTSPEAADKVSVNSSTTSSGGSKTGFQEPDVIASTKLAPSKSTDSVGRPMGPPPQPPAAAAAGPSGTNAPIPVAPPRRKKKSRKVSSSSSEQALPNEGLKLPANDKMTLSADSGGSSSLKSDSHSVEPSVPVAARAATVKSARPTDLPLRNSTTADTVSMSSRGACDRLSSHHSLSSSSVNSTKPPTTSPSNNSGKSNSVPGRGSSGSSHKFDPAQGLSLYKVIRGEYVNVRPQDDDRAAASRVSAGTSSTSNMEVQVRLQMERVERIRQEIMQHKDGNRLLQLAPGTGSNSLGSATRYEPKLLASMNMMEKRRKSAGDEDLLKQLNVYLRTRTESGKTLTDLEILSQVPVKNLDTGEKFPLSAVEEKLPVRDLNPLSLHILRLTSHLENCGRDSDEESVCESKPVAADSDLVPAMDDDDGEAGEDSGRLKRKTAKLRRFFGSTMRKTVDKAKSIASEVSHARHKEDVADIVDAMNPEQTIKIKASSSNKGPYEFTKLQHVQDLSGEHVGAVWCMKFSSCGRLLATAGQDKALRVWVLKDAYPFFQDMRTKYNAEQKSSPTPSQESLVSHNSAEEALAMAAAAEKCPGPFMPRSFCTYAGHTSDLLDVSWSKNYFILSSSMDKTVRLWHISRRECLCCFQHIDFVTAIAFHPRDDTYFLSGSLDGKLRLWNILDKKVAKWTEVDGQSKLITAVNYSQDGNFSIIGTYDGRCLFYSSDTLNYYTTIHVRSSRGRNRIGRKVSGIEPVPGEEKILVTSNDSRVRLYDCRDKQLSCKYKGYVNASSQIKASFSHDGKYIIVGSENQCIYIWKTYNDLSKFNSGLRRDRSDFWEGIKAHNATVTCAIFAPHPEAIIKPEPDDEIADTTSQKNIPDPMVEQHKRGCGYVIVSADFDGAIKVFINKTKPKHSSLPYTACMD